MAPEEKGGEGDDHGLEPCCVGHLSLRATCRAACRAGGWPTAVWAIVKPSPSNAVHGPVPPRGAAALAAALDISAQGSPRGDQAAEHSDPDVGHGRRAPRQCAGTAGRIQGDVWRQVQGVCGVRSLAAARRAGLETAPRLRRRRAVGPSRQTALRLQCRSPARLLSPLAAPLPQVDILDIWTHYTPWPCSQMPKAYSFMVKYPVLWKLGFLATQPRFVHVPAATATAAFVGHQVSRAYDEVKPDLVVSVHPLMQVTVTGWLCICFGEGEGGRRGEARGMARGRSKPVGVQARVRLHGSGTSRRRVARRALLVQRPSWPRARNGLVAAAHDALSAHPSLADRAAARAAPAHSERPAKSGPVCHGGHGPHAVPQHLVLLPRGPLLCCYRSQQAASAENGPHGGFGRGAVGDWTSASRGWLAQRQARQAAPEGAAWRSRGIQMHGPRSRGHPPSPRSHLLQEEQIRLYGLPIRPAFSRQYPPKSELRPSLGLDPGIPVVLLVGGGEGMGPVEKTVDALRMVRRREEGKGGVGACAGLSKAPRPRGACPP